MADESTWKDNKIEEIDPGDTEIRKAFISMIRQNNSTWLSYTDYSNFNKIVYVTMAWVLRYIRNLRAEAKWKRENSKKRRDKGKPYLTPEEIKAATIIVIKDVQLSEFDEEIDDLTKKQEVEKESKLYQFKPFLDKNGILRIGGRLENASVSFEARHQIVIPKGHVASLIAEKYHKENGHSGVNQPLSEVRQKYWILCEGQVIKTVIETCMECQRFKNKPEIPMMADLPASRMQLNQPPFTNTVDLSGPILVNQGRKRLKRWVSLFTCMTVHLEVVESMETDDFLNALQRFISRRQKPRKLLLDCGSLKVR
ncbi:uncharacterized protein [Clytia hemisphaerica]|uniref:uncharacterized protein n=1 Tax=Clytia hemisphaerica TaxID=252671 RepID=UPI0034D4932D